MFYSHTILARKGPLATVWCAAHLQHKLNKTQYKSTNVEKAVNLVMCPEVPISLRMSGHLLLGIVRIYSKQVDYLYEECNEKRRSINSIFKTVSVNLPDDATHAPAHTITLPQKFNLDAIELDDFDWGEDSNLKTKDDITLPEQIGTGRDPYIVVRFDEHDWRGSPIVEDDSGSGPVPMEEDVPSTGPEKDAPNFEYPSPSNEKGPGDNNAGYGSVEHARDAQHGFDFDDNAPVLPSRMESDPELEMQIIEDSKIATPVMKEAESPNALSAQEHSSGHKGVNDSGQSIEIPPSPNVVHQSPVQEILPSPVEQPRPRRNRKRRLCDKSIVLTNVFMKDALVDTSDICRVKRNCPLSSLAIWKHNNRAKLRKEGLFVEPFLTGISTDLQSLYKENSVKYNLVSTEAPHQKTDVGQPPVSEHVNDVEIEIQMENQYESPARIIPEQDMPSQSGRSYFTPGNSNGKSPHVEMTEGEISPAVDGASVNPESEIRTPNTFNKMGMLDEDRDFSDIPELVASPGELGFLEQDDNSPARSQGTPATGDFSKNLKSVRMTSRTRAVAQYLERQSVTSTPGNSGGGRDELSLKKILEGKTRKVCARMFYETLVLKSLRLVDVHQENAYEDITLKVTEEWFKGNSQA